jgi:hypothetical protein
VPDDRLVELLDQGRLADAGIAADQEQGRRPLTDTIEGPEQRLHFLLSSIEVLRQDESLRSVAFARAKWRERARFGPLTRAPLEVRSEADALWYRPSAILAGSFARIRW